MKGERHPDFAPGNTLVVKSGAYSERSIAAKGAELRPRLFEITPWLDPVLDVIAVDRFLRCEVRALLLNEYIVGLDRQRQRHRNAGRHRSGRPTCSPAARDRCRGRVWRRGAQVVISTDGLITPLVGDERPEQAEGGNTQGEFLERHTPGTTSLSPERRGHCTPHEQPDPHNEHVEQDRKWATEHVRIAQDGSGDPPTHDGNRKTGQPLARTQRRDQRPDPRRHETTVAVDAEGFTGEARS
jgi:hypothetical protein